MSKRLTVSGWHCTRHFPQDELVDVAATHAFQVCSNCKKRRRGSLRNYVDVMAGDDRVIVRFIPTGKWK